MTCRRHHTWQPHHTRQNDLALLKRECRATPTCVHTGPNRLLVCASAYERTSEGARAHVMLSLQGSVGHTTFQRQELHARLLSKPHLLGSNGVKAGNHGAHMLHLLLVECDDAHRDGGAGWRLLCLQKVPQLLEQCCCQLCLLLQAFSCPI